MPFPASTVTPPTLSAFQFQFQGLVIGNSTAFNLKKIEGLRGVPAMRTGDAGRPRDQGAFIGLDVLPGRELTLTLDCGPPLGSYANVRAAMVALSGAFVPAGVTEQPLWYSEDGSVVYVTYARPRALTPVLDITYDKGGLAQDIAAQMFAVDPRWYSTPTSTASMSLVNQTTGFAFPLTFPLTFGSTTSAAQATLTNAGNMDTRPKFTITGPCTNPSIVNQTQTGSPTIQFNVAMATGDTLAIDTDLHSALYTYANTTASFSVLNLWAPSAQWWVLPANSTQTILFKSTDGTPVAGTCKVDYASAYLL
jgi:hypothetical protein